VEHVLHAGDLGPGHGVLQLLETDVAQAYPGDQPVIARGRHRRELVVETGVHPPVTGHPEVDRRQLADPEAAQVVLDARAQLVLVVGRADGAGDRDLADDRQPVGIGVERLADQVVDHAGTVVLGGVDVIDPGGHRRLQHPHGRRPVGRRPEGERPGELHRPVPGPPDLHLAECVG
jgi:hypothetical protein